MFNNIIFRLENRAVCDVTWEKKKILEPTRRMGFVCRINTATNTHLENVMFSAFSTGKIVIANFPLHITLHVHCLIHSPQNSVYSVMLPILFWGVYKIF